MGVTHYAAMLYPARALGDRVLWPKLKALLLEWIEDGDNEESLVPQWTPRSASTSAQRCPASGPVHVIAFAEDVEAPPQDGEELAPSSPAPGSTCWRAWGTARGTGTRTRDQ